MPANEKSAGAVIFYLPEAASAPKYLLLHYTAGHWDFAKGNIEKGESEMDAAIREIREETGITDEQFIEGFRKTIEYRYKHAGKLVQKEVVLFLCSTRTPKVVISHEHQGYAWKDYDEAMIKLTYKNAKNVLEAASEYLKRSNA
ncbi:MAG: NUDIX domain-containing protein [Nitrososphaera sp.]